MKGHYMTNTFSMLWLKCAHFSPARLTAMPNQWPIIIFVPPLLFCLYHRGEGRGSKKTVFPHQVPRETFTMFHTPLPHTTQCPQPPPKIAPPHPFLVVPNPASSSTHFLPCGPIHYPINPLPKKLQLHEFNSPGKLFESNGPMSTTENP